jgi:hypothetical protein
MNRCGLATGMKVKIDIDQSDRGMPSIKGSGTVMDDDQWVLQFIKDHNAMVVKIDVVAISHEGWGPYFYPWQVHGITCLFQKEIHNNEVQKT